MALPVIIRFWLKLEYLLSRCLTSLFIIGALRVLTTGAFLQAFLSPKTWCLAFLQCSTSKRKTFFYPFWFSFRNYTLSFPPYFVGANWIINSILHSGGRNWTLFQRFCSHVWRQPYSSISWLRMNYLEMMDHRVHLWVSAMIGMCLCYAVKATLRH